MLAISIHLNIVHIVLYLQECSHVTISANRTGILAAAAT